MIVRPAVPVAGRWLAVGSRKFIEDFHYLQNLSSDFNIPEKVYLVFVRFGDLQATAKIN